MDDDEWQSMPVVGPQRRRGPGNGGNDDSDADSSASSSSQSSPQHRRRQRRQRQTTAERHEGYGYTNGPSTSAANNATGRSLNVRDARGYDWRAKPAGAPGMHSRDEHHSDDDDWKIGSSKPAAARETDSEESDEDDEAGKGYTQLRLDEDVEGDELHAATEYLFGGGVAGGKGGGDPSRSGPIESSVGYSYQNESTATPLSQMMTTKALLSEPQKIAYVGLCALTAKEMVRSLRRVPGSNKDLADSVKSIEEWEVKVLARLFQHMDIDAKEQNMIKSLGEHGVLASDLAPSLVTTQQIENPDYDPVAAEEKEIEEKEKEAEKQSETQAEEAVEQVADTPRTVDAKSPDDVATKSSEVQETTGVEDNGGLPDRPATPEASSAPSDEPKDGDGGEEDDGDGDLGHRPATPTPADVATTSASTSSNAKTTAADDGSGSGDIGAALDDERPPPPYTKQQEQQASKEPPAEPRAKEDAEAHPSEPTQPTEKEDAEIAQPAIADPNTAAQAAAAEANVTADKPTANTFGLSAEPQAVQPPPSALPGVTTELSTTDSHITLDLRWTILCDLFLVLTADSVYDARSRVLLERIAEQLGLTWMDVTKFEKRVTDALEIEEGVEKLKDKSAVSRRAKEARNKKWAMVGLATVGGGLVIGLSAGIAAPLVGAGLAGFLGTVGIGGTTGFLGGIGGAALITTTGALGGAALGGRGMNRRTQSVRTFQFKPIHNNKRINCIVTIPGFMNGDQDDVRLPFSVIDSIMGDVFSVLWEPEMMREMGNAIYILWNETIVMGVQQVLAATIAGGLLGALAWPLWLTKLGYLIDNPWSNALTRAEAAGKILADVLSRRQLGVRPITLVGFSLGARAIFYALCELARKKAFGVVQNVYIFGAPVTASDKTWREARSAVGGRFVNGFSRTDWILGYLFRATSGGLRSIAGLRPVERVPEIENVDVTTSVPGHLQYRAFMPLVLSEVGFRVTQDWFDEPEDLSRIPDREIVRQEMEQHEQELQAPKELKTVKTSTGGFGKIFRRNKGDSSSDSRSASASVSREASRPSTPGGSGTAPQPSLESNLKAALKKSNAAGGGAADDVPDDYNYDDDDLPPREEHAREERAVQSVSSPVTTAAPAQLQSQQEPQSPPTTPSAKTSSAFSRPTRNSSEQAALDDTAAILAELRESGIEVKELESSLPALSLSSAPTTLSAPPKEEIRRPSLKTSVSAMFSSSSSSSSSPSSSTPASRKVSGTTAAAAAPPAMDSPSLSIPKGTYSGVRQPSASGSGGQRSPKLPSSELPQDAGPTWPSSRAGSTDSAYAYASSSRESAPYARPFHAPLSFAADETHYDAAAAQPPGDVSGQLSFASDFDDPDEEERTEDTRKYGLSSREAQELARQFNSIRNDGGGDGDEKTRQSNDGYLSNPFANPSSSTAADDDNGWGASLPPPSIPRPMASSYTPGRERSVSNVGLGYGRAGGGGASGGGAGGLDDEESNPWG